jgi:hypothetical protein
MLEHHCKRMGVGLNLLKLVQTQSCLIFHMVQALTETSPLFILHILGTAGTAHILCISYFIALQVPHTSWEFYNLCAKWGAAHILCTFHLSLGRGSVQRTFMAEAVLLTLRDQCTVA